MILLLLAFVFWLFVAAVGVQLLPWPLAVGAVLLGVAFGARALRRSRPVDAGSAEPSEWTPKPAKRESAEH